jgi:osmoprotectant transport system ATP-binding protein
VGADRGLKRLRVWSLNDLELEPAGDGAAALPTVGEDTSLRDALSLMLVEGVERLTVLDRSGAARGTVALETITRLIGPEKRAVEV